MNAFLYPHSINAQVRLLAHARDQERSGLVGQPRGFMSLWHVSAQILRVCDLVGLQRMFCDEMV